MNPIRNIRELMQNLSNPDVVRQWQRGRHWSAIYDDRVLAAMEQIDRTLFLPKGRQRLAQRDAAVPIHKGQTISQPYVVALMTQALNLRADDRVLEIGTGSGYQTAILSILTSKNGANLFSVERHESLSRSAAETLRQLACSANLRVGDGARGWQEAAPFQAIILTAAPPILPRPIWEQLDEGGRLVAPIGPYDNRQILWRIEKIDGKMRTEQLGDVRFVPLLSPLFNNPAMGIKISEYSRESVR